MHAPIQILHKLFFALVLGCVFYAFIVPAEPVTSDRVLKVWWDFLHLPAFALITFIVWRWSKVKSAVDAPGMSAVAQRAKDGRVSERITTILGLIVVVPVVELIQRATGREYSLVDMAYGWAGIVIAWCWCVGADSTAWWRRVLSVVVLTAAMFYPASISLDRWRLQKAYPVLTGFDQKWVPSRWNVDGFSITPDDKGWYATFDGHSAYPGFFLADVPANWNPVASLHIEVEYAGTNSGANLWWRLDDLPGFPAYGNRFEHVTPITYGRNEVRIDRSLFSRTTDGRAMDLGSIQAAGLFFTGISAGDRVRIHRIELILEPRALP